MPFSDFHGNSDAVRQLRDMLARNRFPQAVILAGPAGSGKYTLALMLAKAMNCLAPESRALFGRVRTAYLAIAAREPERVVVLDARGTPDATHRRIVEVVRRKLRLKAALSA
jgi:DNA polymerase III gamma/tau subunit